MLIPLNTRERKDLCLSIIELKDGQRVTYSVAVMSIANGFGFNELPSWRKLLPDDEENFIAPVACMTDFKIIKGRDLYKCIQDALKQVKESCIPLRE